MCSSLIGTTWQTVFDAVILDPTQRMKRPDSMHDEETLQTDAQDKSEEELQTPFFFFKSSYFPHGP